MKHIMEIMSGIGILIAIYLVLSRGDSAVNLISSLMNSATQGIKILQGRG